MKNSSKQNLVANPSSFRRFTPARAGQLTYSCLGLLPLLGGLFVLAAGAAGQGLLKEHASAEGVWGVSEFQSLTNFQTRVILITDSEGTVLVIDPVSGSEVHYQGGLLQRPYGIAIDRDGTILVTDTSALAVIRIDPRTGRQEVVVSGPEYGVMFGIALDDDGFIYVANVETILRIDPRTRQVERYPRGRLGTTLGVTVGGRGELYVADAAGAVWRLNPRNGAQHLVAKGGYLVQPCGIVADQNGRLFVTDLATRRIVEIDARNGKQRLVTEGENLVSPVGIAIENDEYILVGDPDAFGLLGGIIRVEISTGQQSRVGIGNDSLQNYRCVVVALLPLLSE